MVALPSATAETSPLVETVAIFELLELQVPFWFVAFAGVIVAVNWTVSVN